MTKGMAIAALCVRERSNLLAHLLGGQFCFFERALCLQNALPAHTKIFVRAPLFRALLSRMPCQGEPGRAHGQRLDR